MAEIDPIAYGILTQKVENLESKIDKMEESVERLIAMVNQGKGGIWVGMAVMSGLSSLVGFLTHLFLNKS
jgi:hypothetical protein